MATTLALAMRASMSASGVVSGANDAARAMDKMGRHAGQVARGMSVLKNLAIGAAVVKTASMAADAFSSAARSVMSYAQSVASSLDALNDLSERTGIAVESLQAFQMAGRLSGVDNMTGALQKLTLAIGKAAESGKTEAFANLGLDFEALQATSPEEQFKAVQAAIAALPTEAERAAAAVAIFGKSGVELLPLMNQNLAEVEERMRRLGAVVSAGQVGAIDEMNDALAMVKAMFDGIIGQVVGNLAPIVTSLAEDVMSMVESFNSASGSGGDGIANVITDALLDIAEYFAGIFDYAYENFSSFGVTLENVGAVFSFVGNVFTAVAETLRFAFNVFEIAGNMLAIGIGKMLEALGSWLNQDLEDFGRTMAANASQQLDKNAEEGNAALANAGAAAGRALFGNDGTGGESKPTGPAGRAVASARARMTPEARAQREAERVAKEAERKAAREAAAAKAKADKEAAERQKRQEKAAKEAAKIDKRMAGKRQEIDAITVEREKALRGKSNEALKANDIRSSEGMAQYIALATGREDPAIAEYRKQNEKLAEIRDDLRALQQQQVDILGAAA